MAIIGMRDIIPSINMIPVKKIFCKFDISGDTKEAVVTNKHPVIGGACNLSEVISLEIDVPTNLDFSPVLTVYAYDNVMGFMGSRLLGVTNIPLEKYCRKVLKNMQKVSNAFTDRKSQFSGSALRLDEITVKDKFKGIKKTSHLAYPKDSNVDLP